eukprot:3938020-Rhodomonas_salina.1
MYMIVDSGCTGHFLCTREYYVPGAERDSDIKVTGLGGHQMKAGSAGIFQGLFTDLAKHDVKFNGFGIFVPDTTVSLFSVGQLVNKGHAVFHMGPGKTGTHGMFLNNKEGASTFIPFEWCEKTELWWVAIRKTDSPVVALSSTPASSTPRRARDEEGNDTSQPHRPTLSDAEIYSLLGLDNDTVEPNAKAGRYESDGTHRAAGYPAFFTSGTAHPTRDETSEDTDPVSALAYKNLIASLLQSVNDKRGGVVPSTATSQIQSPLQFGSSEIKSGPEPPAQYLPTRGMLDTMASAMRIYATRHSNGLNSSSIARLTLGDVLSTPSTDTLCHVISASANLSKGGWGAGTLTFYPSRGECNATSRATVTYDENDFPPALVCDDDLDDLGVAAEIIDLPPDGPTTSTRKHDRVLVYDPFVDVVEDEYPDGEMIGPESRPGRRRGPKATPRQILIAPTEESVMGTLPEATLLRWHLRGAHLNPNYIKRVSRHVLGMEEIWRLPADTTIPPCTACIRARSKRKPLPKARFARSNVRLFRLHMDLSATNYRWVDTLVEKSTDNIIKSLDALILKIGAAPTVLRCDAAAEHTSARFRLYLNTKRIRLELAVPGEHHLNPRAEAAIGSLSVRAR